MCFYQSVERCVDITKKVVCQVINAEGHWHVNGRLHDRCKGPVETEEVDHSLGGLRWQCGVYSVASRAQVKRRLLEEILCDDFWGRLRWQPLWRQQ